MKPTLLRFLSLLGVAVAAYAIVSALRHWRDHKNTSGVQTRPEQYTLPEHAPLDISDMDILSRLNNEYAKLTKAVVPSVVSINTAGVREQLLRDPWGRARMQRDVTQGQGSGVIVTHEGHVITNQHVIAGQTQIQVSLHDGKAHTATLIGEDRMLDIAVLKINAPGPFTPLKLGDSSQVQVGQIVFAVGNPFGLSETVTQGIISAKERSISDQQRDLFQTDAAINPGNSGGPLVNLQGEIVGINVAIYSPDKNNPGFQGVGFSIPSNDVKESLRQILEKGRPVHGFLGVRLYTLDERVRQTLGYDQPNGSVVIDVVPDSPAARAGLQVRDIIMEFNQKPVQSPTQLISMVQRTPVGREVPLKVWRAGAILTLSTSVAENIAINPPQVNLSSADTLQLIRKIGVSVRSFTAMERSRGFSGVVVTEVQPEGPAGVHLKENDVIIAVNQTKIESAEQFYEHFLSSISQQSTQLTLIRERSALIVKMPKSEP